MRLFMDYLNVSLFKGESVVLDTKVLGSLSNNVLSFSLLDMNNFIDIVHQSFRRENDDYIFLLDFFNKKCILTLKRENYIMNIGVDNCSFVFESHGLVLKYLLETDDCVVCFKIDWDGFDEDSSRYVG